MRRLDGEEFQLPASDQELRLLETIVSKAIALQIIYGYDTKSAVERAFREHVSDHGSPA